MALPGCGTLQADEARRQLRKPRQHLPAPLIIASGVSDK
jgi:hypothetical protein